MFAAWDIVAGKFQIERVLGRGGAAAGDGIPNRLAGSLAHRVPKLKLVLPKRPEGVQVSMNGANANALIGIEIPVDLGNYALVVAATRLPRVAQDARYYRRKQGGHRGDRPRA